MDTTKKIGLAVASVAVVAAGVGGGAALAATGTGDGAKGYGYGGYGGDWGPGPGGPRGADHDHTEVTGDELAKVTEAVKAAHPDVTVEGVLKDEDGSYDVRATRDDEPVFFEVSADLATITEGEGPPFGRGPGGPGGPGFDHTEVTGAELTKVADAVEAELPAVTVEGAFKVDDGSYRVRGTRDDEPVFFEVSADLATITEHTFAEGRGGPGGRGGHGGPGGPGFRGGAPSEESTPG